MYILNKLHKQGKFKICINFRHLIDVCLGTTKNFHEKVIDINSDASSLRGVAAYMLYLRPFHVDPSTNRAFKA